MPDQNKKFHEFALQSILFKGRNDWYFCYLKSEKLSHALALLTERSDPSRHSEVGDVARRAAILPGDIAHLAAGEIDATVILADIFSILGLLRLLVVRQSLSPENGLLLVREYEAVAERLVRGSHPSPFLTHDHFSVPALTEDAPLLSVGQDYTSRSSIKDNKPKGQDKGQTERMSLILELVRSKKSVSIKEIAAVIKDCSEKTIQRELALLIERGLVRKVGERRWSLYLPA